MLSLAEGKDSRLSFLSEHRKWNRYVSWEQQRITTTNLTSNHAQVGAGIQIPPNAARVLESFGLLEEIKRKGTVLDCLSMRRYKDGSVLCERPLRPGSDAAFGMPWT